jgi:hypothetical protein
MTRPRLNFFIPYERIEKSSFKDVNGIPTIENGDTIQVKAEDSDQISNYVITVCHRRLKGVTARKDT